MMDAVGAAAGFYEGPPVFRDFSRVADETLFPPLPGDCVVGVADVAQSTRPFAKIVIKRSTWPVPP